MRFTQRKFCIVKCQFEHLNLKHKCRQRFYKIRGANGWAQDIRKLFQQNTVVDMTNAVIMVYVSSVSSSEMSASNL